MKHELWKSKVYSYFREQIEDRTLCERLAALSSFWEVKNGTCILEEGKRSDYICLIVSGMVRGFYIDEAGNDVTKCFSGEGDWCCSYSFLSTEPSPFYIIAIEDSVLARFDIGKSNRLMEEFPIMREKIDWILSRTLMQSERRILSFTMMEAKERYQCFLREQPEIAKRAKQEYIASYLGVTPSSLSRIKRSL